MDKEQILEEILVRQRQKDRLDQEIKELKEKYDNYEKLKSE